MSFVRRLQFSKFEKFEKNSYNNTDVRASKIANFYFIINLLRS